jgi:hypothetical protein
VPLIHSRFSQTANYEHALQLILSLLTLQFMNNCATNTCTIIAMKNTYRMTCNPSCLKILHTEVRKPYNDMNLDEQQML